MALKPSKLLRHPIPYRDLTTPDSARKITQQLRDITNAVNEQMQMPLGIKDGPQNFVATFSATYASLSWDHIDATLRPYLDGARIWRVLQEQDAEINFVLNHSKSILVESVRTTRYVDVEVESGKGYIYWVEWMNLDGDVTLAAGGLAGTIS